MEVRTGEVYGFLGRNGSGKTTTIRACMGIVAADSGELEILGRVVERRRSSRSARSATSPRSRTSIPG